MILYTTTPSFQADHQPLPTRGTRNSAGIDLSAAEEVSIAPGDSVWIRTGVAFELPLGTFGMVGSRSGLRRDHRITAFAGIIDSDYRGEIMVNLIRDYYEALPVEISVGQRIAQLLLYHYVGRQQDLVRIDKLAPSERGKNGFGSTGR